MLVNRLSYKDITDIKASVGGYFGDSYEVTIDFSTRKLTWQHLRSGLFYEKNLHHATLRRFLETLEELHVLDWKKEYVDSNVMDGTQWEVELFGERLHEKIYGSNNYPEQWEDFCRLLRKTSGKPFN